jgi:hypothetical protein
LGKNPIQFTFIKTVVYETLKLLGSYLATKGHERVNPCETVPAIISRDLRQMSSGMGAAYDKNIEE